MSVRLPQEPDKVWTGVATLVAIGFVVTTAVLVAIAWLFVKPTVTEGYAPTRRSPLENALFERATTADQIRAAAAQRLEQYQWVDRDAHLVRIPIDRAIDAVVSDPSLIGPTVRQEATR
jgi:hypothetical protein